MTRIIGSMAVLGMLMGANALKAEEIVAAGSEWNWLHPTNGADPAASNKDFNKTFANIDFDDSSWKKGKDSTGPHGGFAYGEDGFTGVDLGTPLDPDQRKTAYFRHYFNTKKGYKDLVLKCQRDDAVIIYIDGKEVGRDNVKGDEDYSLFAIKTIGGDDETAIVEIKLDGEVGPGDHVLAISLHNRPMQSSDLRIAEISLQGTAK